MAEIKLSAAKITKVIVCVFFVTVLIRLHIRGTTSFRLEMAEKYTDARDFDNAIIFYNRILRTEDFKGKRSTLSRDRRSDIYFKLADLYLKKNKFLEASEKLKKLFEIDPGYEAVPLVVIGNAKDHKDFGTGLLKQNLGLLAAQQFRKVVEIKPVCYKCRYELALVCHKFGMENEALTEFLTAATLLENAEKDQAFPLSYKGDIYYNAARSLEKEGHFDRAEHYYEMSMETGSQKTVPSGRKLIEIYKRQNKIEKVASIEKALSELKPQYELDQKVSDELTFLGYSINRKEFEMFNEGQITFFWQVDNRNADIVSGSVGEHGFYKTGNRLYQVKSVKNLAPAFSFENVFNGEIFPHGLGTSRCFRDRLQYGIMPVEKHDGLKGKCFFMTVNKEHNTACWTDFINIHPRTYYILGGRIKSPNGNSYFATRWYNTGKERISPQNYVAKNIGSSEWKYYSNLVPSPGESKYCRILFTNFEPGSAAFLDEVIFIQLDPPDILKEIAGRDQYGYSQIQ